jgi:hypothetical protein
MSLLIIIELQPQNNTLTFLDPFRLSNRWMMTWNWNGQQLIVLAFCGGPQT